jgi:flagellar hook-associated protein 1 FlgK
VSDPGNNDYDPNDQFYDKTLDSSHQDFIGASAYQDKLDSYNPDERPLFSTIDGSAIITAGNIRVSQEWLDDPMHLTVTQPGDIAGENIGRMIIAIDRGGEFYRDGDKTKYPNEIFKGTFEEYFTGVNATLALDVSLYDNYAGTSEHVMTTLFTARESISGINLDEEGVALMTYQKSYNAAVRFFTVLDEAVDRIINSMGLAGR